MPIKAGYLLLAGGGAIIIWSGVRGKPVTNVFRSLIGGENPAKIPQTEFISGVTPTATGSTGQGVTMLTGLLGTTSQVQVNTAILAGLGALPTGSNLASLTAWEKREFSSWPPQAQHNPMASTLTEPGSTQFNSTGVQNYPNWPTGIRATVATINSGRYPNIVAAFRSGKGLQNNPNVANDLLIWSGGGYSSV